MPPEKPGYSIQMKARKPRPIRVPEWGSLGVTIRVLHRIVWSRILNLTSPPLPLHKVFLSPLSMQWLRGRQFAQGVLVGAGLRPAPTNNLLSNRPHFYQVSPLSYAMERGLRGEVCNKCCNHVVLHQYRQSAAPETCSFTCGKSTARNPNSLTERTL